MTEKEVQSEVVEANEKKKENENPHIFEGVSVIGGFLIALFIWAVIVVLAPLAIPFLLYCLFFTKDGWGILRWLFG